MLRLREKVGQTLMAGFPGAAAPHHIPDWLCSGRIRGVDLLARNPSGESGVPLN